MEDLEKKDLKIQALLEKVSSLTTEKENQIADLRVALTELERTATSIIGERDARIQELEEQLTAATSWPDADDGDIVPGEVENVSDETDSEA